MTKDEILNKLIDEILTMPKFKNFEGEKKIVLRNKLIKEYNERINKAIVINMPIEKSEEFLNVLDSKNIEKIDQFIQVNIPNIDDILEAETSKFVQQLILKGQEE
jgi:hypothetical protein